MRVYLINTAPKTDKAKAFNLIPNLQFVWWKGGVNLGVFWLSFGVQIGIGKKFKNVNR
tara:strand:- start:351 stop:524 length:174 start_codon:yes stop_codon:yes gene_type:complete